MSKNLSASPNLLVLCSFRQDLFIYLTLKYQTGLYNQLYCALSFSHSLSENGLKIQKIAPRPRWDFRNPGVFGPSAQKVFMTETSFTGSWTL